MPKILVVEDNEDNRDSLTRRLQRRGFAVLTACDGVEGVKAAQMERPDLILMDVNMPELDGWEATRQIHAIAGFETLPIIALTAHAMGGDRERALEAGCIDYHTKPVEFATLVEQIEKALRDAAAAVAQPLPVDPAQVETAPADTPDAGAQK